MDEFKQEMLKLKRLLLDQQKELSNSASYIKYTRDHNLETDIDLDRHEIEVRHNMAQVNIALKACERLIKRPKDKQALSNLLKAVDKMGFNSNIFKLDKFQS